MLSVKDQLNHLLELSTIPSRIVSLVPSQTELLYDLGLDEEVVGITKFCVHPASWFRIKTRVGGTKAINRELIASLRPDLIIANKEENNKEQVESLSTIAPVFISDIHTLEDAVEMISLVGIITGKQEAAGHIIQTINNNFTRLANHRLQTTGHQPRTAYLIWRHPYMTAGSDTFIHEILSMCGLHNVFENESRYPAITTQELIARNTALVLLSSEPYPFKQKHVEELQKELPHATILLVDGEMFSWYGSRLQYVVDYFIKLLQSIQLLVQEQKS